MNNKQWIILALGLLALTMLTTELVHLTKQHPDVSPTFELAPNYYAEDSSVEAWSVLKPYPGMEVINEIAPNFVQALLVIIIILVLLPISMYVIRDKPELSLKES